MNKKSTILIIATLIIIIFILGCEKEFDKCDLNKEGKVTSINNEINLQRTGVQSSAVHLIELSKI